MMGFKDWFEEEKKYYPLKLDVVSCRKGFKAGAASRQAEIDCLKVELDAANERSMMLLNHKNKMVDKLQGEIDELQNRIDEALDVIYSEKSKVECDVYQGVNADLIIGIGYDLHLILKGKGKENEN